MSTSTPTSVTVRFDPTANSRQADVIPGATPTKAGAMTAAQAAKLDSLILGGVTDVTGTAPITSTGGTVPAIGIAPASTLAPGSMSAADKAKLDALTPAPPPTQFSYFAQTVGANQASVDTYTFPESSAGLLRITVSCVSDFFATGAFFQAQILGRRDGSQDGTVTSYTLLRSVLDASLPGITIQAANAMTGGVLQMLLNGQSGKTIDWTVTIEPYLATQDQ